MTSPFEISKKDEEMKNTIILASGLVCTILSSTADGGTNSAVAPFSPKICSLDEGTQEPKETQETNTTWVPTRAEIKANKDVTFYFKDNVKLPVTINGYDPLPDPVTTIPRNIQDHLWKKARNVYRYCMFVEEIRKHHPNAHIPGVKK